MTDSGTMEGGGRECVCECVSLYAWWWFRTAGTTLTKKQAEHMAPQGSGFSQVCTLVSAPSAHKTPRLHLVVMATTHMGPAAAASRWLPEHVFEKAA